MQHRFSASVTVGCTPERAFDHFADHRNVARVLDGVRRWEPIGRKTTGVGARYNVEMVAMGVPLKSILRIDRWARPHEIGWRSESGLIAQEGGFTFVKVPQGVHIVLHIAYTPPASALTSLLAGRLDWVVRDRLQKALEEIKEMLEASEPRAGRVPE